MMLYIIPGTMSSSGWWRKSGVDPTCLSPAVTPSSASLIIGETVQLSAAVTDAAGTPLRRPRRWSSSDAAVATVDDAGLVTATGAGSAMIAIRAGQAEAQAQITGAPVVAVIPAAASLTVGQTLQLTATVSDVWGNPVVLPVQWSSSAPLIAPVTATGLVTALAVGSATITAEAGGAQARVPITISAPSPGYWTFRAPMPTAHGRLAGAAANGILYTVGGFWNGNGCRHHGHTWWRAP